MLSIPEPQQGFVPKHSHQRFSNVKEVGMELFDMVDTRPEAHQKSVITMRKENEGIVRCTASS